MVPNSTLDRKSGYHQIEVKETHKERTVSALDPLGFWKFNIIPLGLSKYPGTYQKITEECLGECNMKICST